MSIDAVQIPQLYGSLGRHQVHDSRSKRFPAALLVDKPNWVTKAIAITDPRQNPSQCHGECTGVAKCVQMNARGNRVKNVVLGMDQAHSVYHLATTLDPWPDEWPPTDIGSSGLASAKAAQHLGIGAEYRHVFNGADGVVQLIQDGKVVSVGTKWYSGMFTPNSQRIIEPTGKLAGGHQYAARGYDVRTDLVTIRCWWGNFRDVRIKRDHLNDLILDGGDAHVQDRVNPS